MEVAGEGGPGGGGGQPDRSVELDGCERVACAGEIDMARSVMVEVDMGSASSWGRPAARSWLVRLGRADRYVVVAIGLSRVAADHLADSIRDLFEPVADERARSPGR